VIALSQKDEFELWLRSKFTVAFYFKGHRFERTASGAVLVDNGLFQEPEARALFEMLSSSNPITKLNAVVAIWERNGTLLKLLLAAAFLLLLFVFIRIRR